MDIATAYFRAALIDYDPDSERIETTNKRIREFEVVESDRVSLAVQANSLVTTMVAKQIAPIYAGGGTMVTEPATLLPTESKAYNSALGYLCRQFDIGHKDPEVFETRMEIEVSSESNS